MLKDGGEFALALASTTAVPTHPKASIPDTPENVDQAVLQEKLEVTSPPPEGGGFDLRLKSPKDLASDAGDSLDRLSHSARRPLP